jgi:hypothetical protein
MKMIVMQTKFLIKKTPMTIEEDLLRRKKLLKSKKDAVILTFLPQL